MNCRLGYLRSLGKHTLVPRGGNSFGGAATS